MANTEPQVLVTGATGTVGRELVLVLRRLQGPVREAGMQNLQTAYRDIRNHDRRSQVAASLTAELHRPISYQPIGLLQARKG